jgi:hypothetical protein
MDHDRIADAVKQIPDEASIVHVAWVRRNEDGFLNSGSNTLIFEEPLDEGHVDRLSDHLRVYSLTLRQQIGMTPGTTLVAQDTNDRPTPTPASLALDLQDLVDAGKLSEGEAAPLMKLLRSM